MADHCQNCGCTLQAAAWFCPECGAPVSEAGETTKINYVVLFAAQHIPELHKGECQHLQTALEDADFSQREI